MTSKRDTLPGPDLYLLTELCSQAIVEGQSMDDWLSRMESRLDIFFPAPPQGELRNNPDLRRRLLRSMLRAMWKGTPQPSLDYALPRLPEPKRNDPCHCGSGKKYKLCCQPLDRHAPVDQVNLLPTLLSVLPRKRWPELAGSRIDLARMDDTVEQWLKQGEFDSVAALLDPWFAVDSALVGRHEFLFDALLDAYSELGNPRKKSRLIKRALEHGDRPLRVAAMQRQVSILADRGDFDEAWALYGKARTLDPESPNLAQLEVITLIAEGREQEARTRADFWARSLARRRQAELEGLIEFLRDIAQHGLAAYGEVLADQVGAGQLLAAVREAPPPASLYKLHPVDGDAGPLQPASKLAHALAAWREDIEPVNYFPGADRGRGDAEEELERMLELLDQYPQLWNSFEALAEMAYAARELDFIGLEDSVIVPLLDRAERLLELVLASNGAQDCRLEWGHWDNRPALDLLAWRVGLELEKPASPDHIRRIERLLRLNPNDNQGMRTCLARRYLEANRFDEALALSDRYPDDLPEMQYNRVLALYALGRTDQAGELLKRLAGKYPKILKALLKPRIRRPQIDPRGIQLGGDDEAWLYREDYRPLWQSLGALDWAARIRP